MGMYSTIINTSELLGPEFIGNIQTKSFDNMMELYWIAPDGSIYRVDDSETWTLSFEQGKWPRRVPTGQRGRVTPFCYSGIAVVTSVVNGSYHRAGAMFLSGRLVMALPAEELGWS